MAYLSRIVYHRDKDFSNRCWHRKQCGVTGKEAAVAVYFSSEINKRSSNEDSFCDMELRVNHEASVHAMVVADGMGGLAGGKLYSETAVRLWYQNLVEVIMSDEFRDGPLWQQTELLQEFCEDVFDKINRSLYQKGQDAGVKGGTTLSTAVHFWDTWIIVNCGDSPVYQISNGTLSLVSEIQNAAWKMVREGKTKEGSIQFYQNKNRLTQYLGRRDPVYPAVTLCKDKDMQGLILGTDGAFGNLTLKELEEVLCRGDRPQDMIKELFEKAKASGEEDNQTAILYMEERPEQMEEVWMGLDYSVARASSPASDTPVPFAVYTELEEKKVGIRQKLRNKKRIR